MLKKLWLELSKHIPNGKELDGRMCDLSMQKAVEDVLKGLDSGVSGDCLAMDIRQAPHYP